MAAGVSNGSGHEGGGAQARRSRSKAPCPSAELARWPGADPAAAAMGPSGLGSCRTPAWPASDAVALDRIDSSHRSARRGEA